MTAPLLTPHQPAAADPPPPDLHHRSVCTCPDPELLLTAEQVDAIHDYISPEAIEGGDR